MRVYPRSPGAQKEWGGLRRHDWGKLRAWEGGGRESLPPLILYAPWGKGIKLSQKKVPPVFYNGAPAATSASVFTRAK